MVKKICAGIAALVAPYAVANIYAQTRPTAYVLSADAVKFTPLDPKNPEGVNISVVSVQNSYQEALGCAPPCRTAGTNASRVALTV
jgi:hypothetical protein